MHRFVCLKTFHDYLNTMCPVSLEHKPSECCYHIAAGTDTDAATLKFVGVFGVGRLKVVDYLLQSEIELNQNYLRFL